VLCLEKSYFYDKERGIFSFFFPIIVALIWGKKSKREIKKKNKDYLSLASAEFIQNVMLFPNLESDLPILFFRYRKSQKNKNFLIFDSNRTKAIFQKELKYDIRTHKH
jgi:hypothetical protein